MQTVVSRAHQEFGDKWAAEFEEVLERMFDEHASLEAAIGGYADFAVDALRLQAVFEKTREYKAKTYEEAASEVYHNKEYMFGMYLPGILLSHFLWPHHYRQNAFFLNTFLPDMLRKNASFFADVGIGTGFYSRMILTGSPGIHGTGFDISPSSHDYTLGQVGNFGAKDRYNIELRDIIKDTPEGVTDWLVSVEVLEHLEQPLEFLRALRRMLRPDGKAFITAALNAPNADHIYLYRSPSEVNEQLEAAGFVVEQFHSSLAHAPRRPGLPVPEISAFIVT